MVEQPNEWTKTIKLCEGLSETERVKLSYWTKYREIAEATPESMTELKPHKPSKDPWSSGTPAYHFSLLIDTLRGKIGIESCASDDKEAERKAIENASVFEGRSGLKAVPFDAKKASGVRFYKEGCRIKGNEAAWPGYIREQLKWALEMKYIVADLGI